MQVTKRAGVILIMTLLFLMALSPRSYVYASGEGNFDGGGGGFGNGSNTNKWVNGDDGVRVTVVRASDGAAVSASVDLTNRAPVDIVMHFAKTCKTSYRVGASLSIDTGAYIYYQPEQSLPTIISSSSGGSRIAQIKRYFTDEQVLRGICNYCGFDFNTLISGDYKLLVEPLAFVTFQGMRTAMTATEAALYDRLLGGTMQSKMPSLSHKNLPLSIFLETADLGFPAWSGSRSGRVTNEEIIGALGVGIVRFNEEVMPEIDGGAADYEYRVNTDVITAVSVRGGQSDPDHPVNVTFQIDGASYTVQNVYYPKDHEQLVWVRWHTPPTPQTITITVTASGTGSPAKGTLTAKIVDLDGYDPPNPTADDRNDSYSAANAVIPTNMEQTSAHWSIWRPWWQEHWVEHSGDHKESCAEDCDSSHSTWEDEGWWEFDIDYYSASFSADMTLTPDEKSPTASAATIKSGYGVNIKVNASASASDTSAVTEPQTAVSYFPEFYYQTYWRLLERTSSGMDAAFQFKPNEYSTYNRRTHFTPIWMKDGSFTVYTYVIDCWTPDGMLCKNLTGNVNISGDLWKDWHIAPKK